MFPWWGWVIIAVLILLLILNFRHFRSGIASAFARSNSSSSAAVYLDLRHSGGIDLAVQRDIIEKNQAIEQELIRTISKGAEKGSLKEL